MAALSLKAIAGPRAASFSAVQALWQSLGGQHAILDLAGKPLLGSLLSGEGIPVRSGDILLGHVAGPEDGAIALASLLSHLATRESEGRALAGEVLHLYREVHLIEQLSEQLAAMLNLSSVCLSALGQAQRLIDADLGGILVFSDDNDSTLEHAGAFDTSALETEPASCGPLSPASRFAASVLERGIAEIVNDCSADARALESERQLHALICAPLRAGQRHVGVIALASTRPGSAYTAADLKLLNTIALQTGAAIANARLCEQMVDAAQARAAYAAELQAASTVQQLLLQSASRATPGFHIDSVYLPASEVGGDFFLVSPAEDGALTAIVGDVSGKGLTAAMRVAMILGALRRESSSNPAIILAGLNNALIAQGQLGFTTACCIRIALTGEYAIANAGHIAPYISGRELDTPAALPLGLVPDQAYDLVRGQLAPGERLVLMSDGVPEARAANGALYGFEELAILTQHPAAEIAEAARLFGQEDDITVLTVSLSE